MTTTGIHLRKPARAGSRRCNGHIHALTTPKTTNKASFPLFTTFASTKLRAHAGTKLRLYRFYGCIYTDLRDNASACCNDTTDHCAAFHGVEPFVLHCYLLYEY